MKKILFLFLIVCFLFGSVNYFYYREDVKVNIFGTTIIKADIVKRYDNGDIELVSFVQDSRISSGYELNTWATVYIMGGTLIQDSRMVTVILRNDEILYVEDYK